MKNKLFFCQKIELYFPYLYIILAITQLMLGKKSHALISLCLFAFFYWLNVWGEPEKTDLEELEEMKVSVGLFLENSIYPIEETEINVEPIAALVSVEIKEVNNLYPSQCTNCKYHHGNNEIVCAVHPSGYGDENNCPDQVKKIN